ncbi:hypothetical protein ACWGIU_02370 [Streptomyces sp. NPDC054840]
MAITVGSVEVDVIPNTRGIYARLQAGLVPAATRAGDDAGEAAGRSFGPAMQRQLGAVGLSIGEQIGQQISNRIVAQLRGSLSQGLQQGGPQARATAAREGQEVGGAFSRSLKAKLEAAFRSLPKINIDANTSEADSDLQALRVRMETLASKRIGIDIDAAAAKAEIRLIEAELERLGARHPNVQVRADTAAARAQLALVRAEIDAVDGKRARIDVDTSGALSAILHLTVAIGGLAVIPAIPILAAGIGAIGSAAVASAAGVGALAAVAAPAFINIAGALQAQKAAQEAATAASQRGAQGAAQAAIAQAKYQAALDKLSPSARGTFDAFQSLRTAFKGWSESLQPAVMPLFTRALDGIRNSLPGLTPFVLAAAKAIGILQDKVSAGFKSPWWISFRDDLAKAVVPATVGLGVAIGNVFKTLGGIVDAFLPHMDEISLRMREITGRWATWATGLKGTDKFTNFLAYSAEQGPILAKVIGDIGAAIFQISRATAPLAGPVLGTLGAVLTAVASIAETLPWLIQLMYAAWVVTKLWTLSLIIFNAVMSANPIVLIVIGIVALVAAVIYAYKHWTWFREVVDAAWRGIVAGAQYVWAILQPILAGIWTALQVVGAVALWLWENGIRPAFEQIWQAARFLWAVVAVAVIAPLVIWFKILGAIAMWLWESTFKPAFEGIAAAAMWLWTAFLRPVFGWIADAAVWLWREKISPAWEALRLGTRLLGERFRELRDSYVKPIFEWIAEKAGWLYENGIKPHFDRIKTAVGLVKDAFSLARDGIKTVWNELEEITRKPVRFIVETVYNGGIVPVWNAVAKIAGLNQLEKMRFATGGSVFGAGTATSDSIPALLSNGEHVWTAREVQAAGGHSVVESLRSRALQSGATFAAGGAVGLPRFADGGVVDWLSGKAQQIGSAVMTAFDFMANPAKGWDTATQVLRDKIGENLTGNQWAQALSQLPLAMLKGLKTKVITATEELIGGGTASGSVAAAMGFARSQAGKPYQWGGAGNPSWDCSGFMSGIQKVILGQSPLGRLWSTFSFQGDTAPAGWHRGLRSPFMVGITNNGVGHTAGTLAGMNVESRGGEGVVVGSRARGYNNSLFQDWYGFAPALGKFDSGGYLQPGMNLAYNGTGRPEPVFTTQQANALTRMSTSPASGGLQPGDALTLVVGEHEFDAYVDTRADARVVGGMRQLGQTTQPGRRG